MVGRMVFPGGCSWGSSRLEGVLTGGGVYGDCPFMGLSPVGRGFV